MIMTNITSKKLNIEFHEIDTKSDINRLLAIFYFTLIIWTYEHLYSSIICRSLKICYQSKTIVDYLFHKKIHLVLRFFCWFFLVFFYYLEVVSLHMNFVACLDCLIIDHLFECLLTFS